MKKIIFFFIILIQVMSACNLPTKQINLFIKYKNGNIQTQDFIQLLYIELKKSNFKVVDYKNEASLIVDFKFLGYDGMDGVSDKLATYTVSNIHSDIIIQLEKKAKTSFSLSFSGNSLEKENRLFVKSITKQFKDEVLYNQCEKFQLVFNQQIAIEEQQLQQGSQQRALADVKEEKRRQALAKLAQEENYTKLKKVLKIKPEYRTLLDDRTKTMLIGPFTLGEMSKSLRNGVSDTQMIREIEDTSFRYSSSFTFKQRNHLQEAGFSNKLIDYLELHTQEIEIQREQERRLARLERQREREIEEAQEAREEDRRSARRARERQEENDAGPSRSEAFASWQRDFQAGLDRDMDSINRNSNQFIKQYNQTQRNSKSSSSKSNYDSSSSNKYKSEYNSRHKRTISNYNEKIAEIERKKQELQRSSQRAEVRDTRSRYNTKLEESAKKENYTCYTNSYSEVMASSLPHLTLIAKVSYDHCLFKHRVNSIECKPNPTQQLIYRDSKLTIRCDNKHYFNSVNNVYQNIIDEHKRTAGKSNYYNNEKLIRLNR